VRLESQFSNRLDLSICRLSRGDFELFINKLENIKYFYITKPEFVICGVINYDYLPVKYQKQYLNSLVTSSNNTSIVGFPTIIQNYSSTVTGNIFKVTSRNDRIILNQWWMDYVIMVLNF
jgi:hypothetical protein